MKSIELQNQIHIQEKQTYIHSNSVMEFCESSSFIKELQKQNAFSNFRRSHQQSQNPNEVVIKIIPDCTPPLLERSITKPKQVSFNPSLTKTHYFNYWEQEKVVESEIQNYIINHYDNQVSDSDEDIDDEMATTIITKKNNEIKGILKQKNNQHQMQITVLCSREDQKMKISKNQKKKLQQQVQEHQYGVGFKFLQKYGFECGQGLGLRQQGILEPLQAINKNNFDQQEENEKNRKKIKIDLLNYFNSINEVISNEDIKQSKPIQYTIIDE